MKINKIFYSLLSLLILINLAFSYEEEIQHENGYYYVIIKKTTPKKVNAAIVESIYAHDWDVVHTVNVDLTTGLKTFYKTHLICKESYLSKGVKIFPEIGNLIPCRISVVAQGSDVKVMVEDVEEIAKLYKVEDKKFYDFIRKVQLEINDILLRAAAEIEPKTFKPMY
jgi:hypothetical protein